VIKLSDQQIKDPFTLGPEWADKLEAVNGFNPDQVKFVIYGESGSGKTVFASTWPRPVFLDLDKGMASIRREVHRFPINTWEDLSEVCGMLRDQPHPFKTVVLDSLNELQKLAMRNVVETYTSVRRSYDNLPGIGDYGKMLADADGVIRFLRALPLNIVLITQVANRVFETDPVQPQLTGKNSARDLCRMVDIVGFIDKTDSEGGGPKTRVLTFEGVNYVTKDRSGVLPSKVEHPTYEVLRKYWDTIKSKSTQEK
jgi:hypothetical protein